ncbi:MAG TPA: hypothetical protein VFU43_27325 [Streptosporangiaceae bacterium]|nr:hypothetical protein [Streptosporangiaceae bacterium]
MDWNDFARRLAAELVRLPVDAYVIVQGTGGFPYVQAARHPNGLAGEAVSDTFLSERLRLNSAQTSRMIALGWREPDGHGRVNWWRDLVIPAATELATPEQLAECDRLADRMAAALREVYGVRSPDELEYRAVQNGRGGGPLPLPGLGLRPADPVPLPAPQSPGDPAGPGDPPEPGPLHWPEFTERLAGELAGLDDGMVLVVHRANEDAYYVQAHRDPRRLRGEAVGNELLDESLRFAEADEKRLTDAGWSAPGPNWWIELPPTPSPAECRRLAAMMVTALRDVQKARDPADLRYEAFRGDTGIELTGFGIELADPASVSERRPARPPAAEAAEAAWTAEAAEAAAAPERTLDPAEVEGRLVEAKRSGDQTAYLALIGQIGLIVPSTGTSPGVEFATTQLTDGTYVLTFTSPEAMHRVLRDQARHHRHVTMPRLAAEWPNPEWRLSIDLGLPSEAYFDASVVAGPVPSGAVPSGAVPPAEPGPGADSALAAAPVVAAPGLDAAAGAALPPAIMQKVVPHQLVVHYLEGGYDRVAGYVHRAQDVADLTTPERLVRGLGLTYENSPFSPDDAVIHVIRWPAYKPALFKTPLGGVDEAAMRSVPDGWVIERPPFAGTGFAPGDGPPIPEFKIASQRLPHGAEMHRVEHTGEATLVAVFDADLGQWLASEP